ncbi:MAG: hypothetical protein NC301_03020 [Bacteroides sp.]|nr:hypothetical protein [Bacteroides sp.]MCM1378966.1 hypothetical protein [Bacteroides sp.]MCM1445582.1 hypothetical protein [Prevotella sp.]
MKKSLFLVAAAALSLCSCKTTISHTATTMGVDSEIINRSSADLVVSPNKITYTFNPSKAYQREGEKGVIRAAVAKALEANGNADVLVAPQYEVKKSFTGVKYVIVKGYPATYKNVHNTTLKEAEVVNVLNGGTVIVK